MAKSPKVTPSLYFPCRGCGLWRRQHVGKERKCPFDAGNFSPTHPRDLSAKGRIRLLERIERLQIQLVERPSKRLDELDSALDKLVMAASECCSHTYDNGATALDRQSTEHGTVHVACELCKEDWYE